MNGSEAPTTSSATATFVGKPTANTFSWGTTRETTPKATSVISSATTTGAATSRAAANTVLNTCSAPPTSEDSRGPLVSGHELEGAIEAAQRPGVAADDQEDHRPDERVEAGDDGAFLVVHGVDQAAVGEAGEHVDHRAGRFDGAHQHGQREGEAEADEHALDHQARERQRVGGDVLAVQRDRRQADRDPDGDQATHVRRDDLRGEQRRDEEQRRHAREHQDEADELVARELAEELGHEPTIVGIDVYSAVV